MFAEERHNEILNILNYEGKIVVKDLSNRFNVTEDCIRKDLNISESKALLRRTYGGAIPYRTAAHQESMSILKSEENRISVISPGGVLDKDFNGFTGSATIETLSNYKLNTDKMPNRDVLEILSKSKTDIL